MSDIPQALTPNTWPVGTEVILTQVPWDANYRDIVVWDSQEERDDYFDGLYADSKRWTSKQFSYLPPNDPISIPVPYSAAYKYNYVVVQNPMQPVEYEEKPIKLCYFITSATYVNPQTTMITLQLDVIQTYQFGVRLGSAYIERGHFGLANAKLNVSLDKISGRLLRNYLNVPEGLDVGSEYVMANHEWYPLTEPDTGETGRVIIMSTANLAADPGTVDSPNLNVADGQSADGIPSGCNVYSMTLSTFRDVMLAMQSKSWVAQCIVSISTYPARLLSAGPEVKLFGTGPTINFLGETDTWQGNPMPYATTGNIFQQLSAGVPSDWRSKLYKAYTYPYSVIELTAYNGNSVFLKPELVLGDTLALHVIGCAVAPFARAGIFPTGYGINTYDGTPSNYYQWVGFDGKQHTGNIMPGDFLDTCLWLGDFPQFSIVNSSYLTYLASTSHTRQYQYQSAGWSNSKSLAAAENAYQNATLGANTTQSNFDASLNGLVNSMGQQVINSPMVSFDGWNTSTMAGATPAISIGAFATPSLADVYANSFNSSVAPQWSSLGNMVSNLTGATQNANNVNLARQVAGNNLDYAKFAAQGDYANQIAAINATVQDAALQPPSTAGQMGGQGFMWKNGIVGFAVNYKCATGSAFEAVCQFWARYGYKMNRYFVFGESGTGTTTEMKTLKLMSKFTYWKTTETYLTCATANEAEKDAIRGILEKGVTVWGDPADIGTTALTDNELEHPIDY